MLDRTNAGVGLIANSFQAVAGLPKKARRCCVLRVGVILLFSCPLQN